MDVARDLPQVVPALDQPRAVAPLQDVAGRPVVVVRKDIPNAKTQMAKRLALYANRTGQVNLDWNPEEIGALKIEDPELIGRTFTVDELEGILTEPGGAPADAEPQIDRAAELNKVWKVKTGDLFGLGAFTRCPKCGKIHNIDIKGRSE